MRSREAAKGLRETAPLAASLRVFASSRLRVNQSSLSIQLEGDNLSVTHARFAQAFGPLFLIVGNGAGPPCYCARAPCYCAPPPCYARKPSLLSDNNIHNHGDIAPKTGVYRGKRQFRRKNREEQGEPVPVPDRAASRAGARPRRRRTGRDSATRRRCRARGRASGATGLAQASDRAH